MQKTPTGHEVPIPTHKVFIGDLKKAAKIKSLTRGPKQWSLHYLASVVAVIIRLGVLVQVPLEMVRGHLMINAAYPTLDW